MRVNGGGTADYATFAGMAAKNDNNEATDGYNVWGLFQKIAGGYLWKGLMRLGYTSAVDFRDSDVLILIDETDNVTAGFNKIDVEQSGSRVDWTNITIQALGTVSPGAFECVADADINWDGCKFIDMGTFVFDSASTILNTTWQRCTLVTSGAGVFTGCTFEESTSSSSILCAAPAEAASISNTHFMSDGSTHAIEITGTAANVTLSGNTFSGYAASDGSTGNECIYVNIASGSMTISISGDGDFPSIRTAGATVLVQNTKILTVTVQEADGTKISGARVGIYKLSDRTEIHTGTTTAGGVVQKTDYNYTVDTAVYIRARLSPDGATRYVPSEIPGTITTTGLNVVVTLFEDEIAE